MEGSGINNTLCEETHQGGEKGPEDAEKQSTAT
jgi:hypothetical protein